MKRILLPLSLLALLLFAVGLLFTTASQNVASSNAATVKQSSDTHATDAPMQARAGSKARSSRQAKLERDATDEADLPAALGRHLKKLMETIPGNGGEGPAGSAAEWRFMARAYPDTDISLDKIEGARAAHAAHLAKGFASTNAATPGASTWVSLGPSSALYPLSPFRTSNNYVPNAYLAGGRTTALAIDPGCIPGNCRLWATPAGGGVWRTNDALKTQPIWTYLSGSFAINAAGSVTLDPNNSNNVWVGTGEANASGDSEAGVGLYKSTNGGDTFTLDTFPDEVGRDELRIGIKSHENPLVAKVRRVIFSDLFLLLHQKAPNFVTLNATAGQLAHLFVHHFSPRWPANISSRMIVFRLSQLSRSADRIEQPSSKALNC